MVAKQTEQKTIYKTVDKNTQKHTRYTLETKIMGRTIALSIFSHRFKNARVRDSISDSVLRRFEEA